MCSLTEYFHFHWMIQLLTVILNSENNKKETVKKEKLVSCSE